MLKLHKLRMHLQARSAPAGNDTAKAQGWQDTILAPPPLLSWNGEPYEDADLKRLHAVMVANDADSIDHTEA